MPALEVRVEAVIFNSRGELLLARHRKKGENYWVLPGGHIEFGESMESALQREIHEELHLPSADIMELYFTDEYIEHPKRHVIKVGFRVALRDDEIASIRVEPGKESIDSVQLFNPTLLEESSDRFYPSKDFYLELLDRRYG